MSDFLDDREFLESAVSTLSAHAATHAPKAVLSMLRLAVRFPSLPPDHWRAAGLEDLPRAVGLIAESVSLPEGIKFGTPDDAVRLASRGLLPLAYPAFHAWVQTAGFEGVVLAYRTRAAVEPGYLGHGFSVWCSFLELAALLERHAELIPWATERFCEFVSRMFPGYPPEDPSWRLPDPGSLPEITREELMSAALSRPGFFGHPFLSLAALVRHGERLTREEWRAQAWAQLQATTRRFPDSTDHERLPIRFQGPDTMEEMVIALSLGERNDVHNLTLADALCTLWNYFPGADTRARLLAIGAHYARAPETRPPA